MGNIRIARTLVLRNSLQCIEISLAKEIDETRHVNVISGGWGRGAYPPYGPNFSQFHAAFLLLEKLAK